MKHAFILALVAGCSQYTVIKQAQPAPFAAAQCKITLAPLSFDGMHVGNTTEADWLEKKGPEEVASHVADKQTVATLFEKEVIAKASPFVAAGTSGVFIAKARVTGWEPGFFTAFVNRDTEASIDVEITDAKGAVIDEVVLNTRVPASYANPSVGGRFHSASRKLAEQFASYLNERLGCPR